MKRLLVTGARDWTDEVQLRVTLTDALDHLGRDEVVTLVHGACPTGADAVADRLWRAAGWPIERYPALWTHLGRSAGPARNTRMVRDGADLCVAFLLPNSRGTRDCAAKARAAGIELWEVHGTSPGGVASGSTWPAARPLSTHAIYAGLSQAPCQVARTVPTSSGQDNGGGSGASR